MSPDGEADARASALACCTDILGTCQAQHKALARSSQSPHTGPSGPRDRELPFGIADRGKAVELSASNLKKDRCVSQSNTPMAVLQPKTASTTNTHTAETTPAPGPKSEAASRMASTDMSCQDSPDSSHRAEYKGGGDDSILFAQGPSGGGMNAAGVEMIAHGDHVVKADVGWTSKPHAEPRDGGQTSFWAAMTGRENVRSVPLRPLGQGSDLGSLPFPGEHTQARTERDVQQRQLQRHKNRGGGIVLAVLRLLTRQHAAANCAFTVLGKRHVCGYVLIMCGLPCSAASRHLVCCYVHASIARLTTIQPGA